MGVKLTEEFYKAIYEKVLNIDVGLQAKLEHEQALGKEWRNILEIQTQELHKVNQALKKIFEAYEDEIISKEDFVERKAAREYKKSKQS